MTQPIALTNRMKKNGKTSLEFGLMVFYTHFQFERLEK